MELVASLPTELCAIADPAARGAAPLLRPDAGDGAVRPAAVPFELFLELLAGALPGGEGLPAAGNDLPFAAAAPAEITDAALDEQGVGLVPTLAAAVLAGLRLQPAPLPSADAPAAPAAPAAAGLPALALAAEPNPPSVASAPAKLPGVDAAAFADVPLPIEPATDGAVEPPSLPSTEVDVTDSAAPAATLRDALFAAGSARHATPRFAPEPQPVTPPLPAGTAPPPAAVDTAARAAPPPELVARAVRTLERDSGTPAVAAPAVPTTDTASVPRLEWSVPAALQAPAGSPGAAPPAAAHAAPPHTPLDLRSPSWQEAFAGRVQWLVDHRVGEARIKLNPAELGAIDVKISLVEDRTFVQLTAATTGARDELAHGLPRLRELFAASGLELGGASVHGGHDGGREPSAEGQRTRVPIELGAFDSALGELAAAPAAYRAAGRIDVFA